MKNATLLAILLLLLCVINSFATGTVSNLGPGVNTAGWEANPFVNDDGLTMYFDNGSDIYKATKVGGIWTNVEIVNGVNSSSNDTHPWVVGNHMYFATSRWGTPPFYASRLAMATFSGGAWGNVVQLPMSIIEGMDFDPTVTADETTLYFTTIRAPSYGMGDIYKATFSGGIWGNLENLGPIINSSAAEACPAISPGGSTLHFIRDIRFVYFSNKTGSSWTVPQLLPPLINDLSLKKGLCYKPGMQKLFFGSDRVGTYGSYDLWEYSNYSVIVEPITLGKLKSTYRR